MASLFRPGPRLVSTSSSICFSLPLRPTPWRRPYFRKPLAMTPRNPSPASSAVKNRKLPILLFDVMDTLVRDPFYHDVPAFFRMAFKELLEEKHPTAWLEFEQGSISEMELAKKFFKDGRPVDIEGLKDCMRKGYQYVDGTEALLEHLKQNNYEIHAFTNYPIWYLIIEDKLKLSAYLSWSFCSCIIGKRKPDPEMFIEVSNSLGVQPQNCIFIDDRLANVEAARNVGMIGLHFKSAASLQRDLSNHGVQIQQLPETSSN